MRILVTSGATREPIDGVRFITNMSSGETGAALADHFTDRGHEVTLLLSTGAARPKRASDLVRYGTFADLEAELRRLIAPGRFDAVVHLAAVSDYSVAAVRFGDRELTPGAPELAGKLASSAERIDVQLRRNPKLVDKIKFLTAPSRAPRLVAFKLTRTEAAHEQRAAIEALASHAPVDFIVHNDLLEIARTGEHEFRVYAVHEGRVSPDPLRSCLSRRDLAAALLEVLSS